jgi:hypothetical protein
MATKPTAPPPAAPAANGLADSSVTITPTRPVRRAWDFFKGTVKGTLDGMARWAKLGMWFGIIGGIAVGAGTGMAVGYVLTGILAGMLGAIALGGTLGMLTGGYRQVKYGDQQEAVRNRGKSNGIFYQEAIDRDAIADRRFERGFQQSQELDAAAENYWTNKVSSEPRGYGGRGF